MITTQLSASEDKTIRVWSLDTQQSLFMIRPGGAIIYDFRLCENKLVAAVTGEPYQVRL